MIVSGLDGHGEEINDKKIIMQKAMEMCDKIKDPDSIVRLMVLMLMCLECSQNKRAKFINKIKEYPQYEGLI